MVTRPPDPAAAGPLTGASPVCSRSARSARSARFLSISSSSGRTPTVCAKATTADSGGMTLPLRYRSQDDLL
ncbi:hypothetical protein [Streptomyces sp. DvalAA-19]|uniref:hypothetical protein n=1 Tax=Streptomyces sp. DvalAA-19 TaxID=1839761 RepID=UPI000B8040EE|nr:hypothetical protein [Streptomyces sp. DvalAA-19]